MTWKFWPFIALFLIQSWSGVITASQKAAEPPKNLLGLSGVHGQKVEIVSEGEPQSETLYPFITALNTYYNANPASSAAFRTFIGDETKIKAEALLKRETILQNLAMGFLAHMLDLKLKNYLEANIDEDIPVRAKKFIDGKAIPNLRAADLSKIILDCNFYDNDPRAKLLDAIQEKINATISFFTDMIGNYLIIFLQDELQKINTNIPNLVAAINSELTVGDILTSSCAKPLQ